MKVVISRNEAKAALICAAEPDGHDQFKGIRFELQKDGSVIVVSTNGQILSALVLARRADWYDMVSPDLAGQSFTIRWDQLKASLVAGDDQVSINCPDFRDESGSLRQVVITGRHSGIRCMSEEIGKQYPDWRKIIPDKVNQNQGFFSPTLLGYVEKFSDLIGLSYDFLQDGEDRQGVASFGTVGVFVVMPRRKTSMYTKPDWAKSQG